MRTKYARKLSSLFMWPLYVQLGGQNRYAFVWAVMINLSRTVARKFSLGGLYVSAGNLDIENLLKSPLIYSVSYFIWRPWDFVYQSFGVTKAPPWQRHWIRLKCQILTRLEMMHVLRAQVWSCISAHPGLPHQKTKRETNNASKSQLNQASWNKTVF